MYTDVTMEDINRRTFMKAAISSKVAEDLFIHLPAASVTSDHRTYNGLNSSNSIYYLKVASLQEKKESLKQRARDQMTDL